MGMVIVCGKDRAINAIYTEEHLNYMGIRENFPRMVPLELHSGIII